MPMMELESDLTKWDVEPREAVQVQKKLRSLVQLRAFSKPLRFIAGADVSFNKYNPRIYAGFVILDAKNMSVVERSSAVLDVKFPYVPGLLSFREIPPLMKAWEGLKIEPDVIVFDGQGIAHPRRLGIASHAGLILGRPTIGCAKSLLTGVYEEPTLEAGATEPLVDRKTGERIGTVFRTKSKVKPVFVSPGHLMDIESSLRVIRQCVGKYRIPEPTRQAHLFVNEVRLSDNPMDGLDESVHFETVP